MFSIRSWDTSGRTHVTPKYPTEDAAITNSYCPLSSNVRARARVGMIRLPEQCRACTKGATGKAGRPSLRSLTEFVEDGEKNPAQRRVPSSRLPNSRTLGQSP